MDAVRFRVPWRDLVALSAWEVAWEMSLSVPWLAASLWAYRQASANAHAHLQGALAPVFHWLIVGAALSFFFFLTGLRQSHHAQHASLGIGRIAHDCLLFVLSVAMLTSMHAIRVTHLHHHRHCLDSEDEEAIHASWPLWKVVLWGPYLIVRLHRAGWRLGRARDRRFIAAEVGSLVIALSLVFWFRIPMLMWHIAAMVFGECLTGFFAVWIVHRGCHADGQIARTQRGWLKNLVSYSMFFHLEHHLWPAVPTCHLHRLAERLDEIAPDYPAKQVIG